MKDAKRKAATMLISAALATAPGIANACAMCGLSPGDSAGHAFNASVLFMLLGPYVTFGLIGGFVCMAYLRGRRRERNSASPQ